jgi:hypothetical protein
MMLVWLFAVVVGTVLAMAVVDLLSEKKQLSKTIVATCLILAGATMIMSALDIALTIALKTGVISGVEVVGISVDDIMKLFTAIGLSQVGLAIVTGGFSLIVGGKYELSVSSTEPISGVDIKK